MFLLFSQVLLQREAPLRHYKNDTLLEARSRNQVGNRERFAIRCCKLKMEAVERGSVLLLRALLMQMRSTLSPSTVCDLLPSLHVETHD